MVFLMQLYYMLRTRQTKTKTYALILRDACNAVLVSCWYGA